MCAKLRAERSLKFELAEQRFDTALKLRIVCDDICEVRAPSFSASSARSEAIRKYLQ